MTATCTRPSFEARRRRLAPQDDGGVCCGVPQASSPSLPRRDDLDLVAAVQPRLCPFALRQHVVIQRDRKMRALIFELAQQRIDPRRGDFPLPALDGHPPSITSLPIFPDPTHPTAPPTPPAPIQNP